MDGEKCRASKVTKCKDVHCSVLLAGWLLAWLHWNGIQRRRISLLADASQRRRRCIIYPIGWIELEYYNRRGGGRQSQPASQRQKQYIAFCVHRDKFKVTKSSRTTSSSRCMHTGHCGWLSIPISLCDLSWPHITLLVWLPWGTDGREMKDLNKTETEMSFDFVRWQSSK